MILGSLHVTPFLEEHVLMLLLSILVWFSQGYNAPLYRQLGSLFRWVGAFHIRKADYLVILSDTGVTYPFHSPHFILSCLL